MEHLEGRPIRNRNREVPVHAERPGNEMRSVAVNDSAACGCLENRCVDHWWNRETEPRTGLDTLETALPSASEPELDAVLLTDFRQPGLSQRYRRPDRLHTARNRSSHFLQG